MNSEVVKHASRWSRLSCALGVIIMSVACSPSTVDTDVIRILGDKDGGGDDAPFCGDHTCNNGETCSSCPEDCVVGCNGQNLPPVAYFSILPTSGEAPLTVDLDASQSLDPEDGPLAFAWDFGDGSTGFGETTGCIFQTTGTYTITLTVTDNHDQTDTATGTVTVSALAFPDGWHPSSGLHPHYFKQSDSNFQVVASHPRLFFRQEDLDWIRQRGAGSMQTAWNSYAGMADYAYSVAPDSSEATASVDGYRGDCGAAVAFFALVDSNANYLAWAVGWAKALGDLAMPTDDGELRARITRLAVVYDWLYELMSGTDRTAVYSILIRYMAVLRDWGYIQNPGYLGGHERYGFGAYAMGLIALEGDWAEADDLLPSCRDHIVNGFYPAQAWMAQDGGYHMGWAYTAAYTNFDLPYFIWTVGTNDVLLEDWMGATAYWYLYGLQGDNLFPEMGDEFANVCVEGCVLNTTYSVGINKDGHAKWYWENKVDHGVYPLMDLLGFDPAVAAVAPDDLPLGRHFAIAGMVIGRDGWDEGATHFTFKSGSYFSVNHHHREENAFTLHYKGRLALDSGYYDQYGSSHWANYFIRTIAHNAITVFDPSQDYSPWGDSLANDGGQVFWDEPTRLVDIQPGGSAALDGIVRFENRAAFTYASGDATKAYDPARVTLAQRDIVYLRSTSRPHPVILILDRVESTDASFEKRFLLHTVNEPSLQDKRMVVTNQGGRLTLLALNPADAVLRVVGGAGQEFLVDGVNYPLDPNGNEGQPEAGEDPGAWRLEIVPGTPKTLDYFLSVLFVDDDTAAAVESNAALLIDATDCLGARVAGWTVVFARDRAGAATLTYALPASGPSQHLACGLSRGAMLSYSVDGSKVGDAVAGEGGCLQFELSADAGAVVSIP